MIKNAQLATPRITFDLGQTVKAVNIGAVVKIWQKTPYAEGYLLNGQPMTGFFEEHADTAGTFEIRAQITTPTNEVLESNPLILIVL